MKYIDADKLIAEIERRLHFDNNWIEGDKRRQMRTSGVSSAYYKRIGSKHACENLLDFVISLQQEQLSLPSGLDDAAEKYSENILANNEDLQDAIEDAFKAGAEWMARQGELFESTVFVNAMGDSYVDGYYLSQKIKEGEKVIIQIRKK